MKRSVVIEKLIFTDLEECRSDSDALVFMLRHGWVGYDNVTNERLESIWWNVFEEKIKVTGKR